MRSTINVREYNIYHCTSRVTNKDRQTEREREIVVCVPRISIPSKIFDTNHEDFIGVSSESCCLNYINQAIAMVLVTNSIFMQ